MKSSIVHVKSQMIMPEGLLVRLLKTFNGAYGEAVLLEDKQKIVSLGNIKPANLQMIKEVQTRAELKAHTKIFQFIQGDISKKEYLPPYPILKDDAGKDLLSVFLAGDYSRFVKEASDKPDALVAVEVHFRNTIQRDFKVNGKDLEKFIDFLGEEETGHDYLGGLDGAVAVFVSHTGDVVLMSNVDNHVKDDWGWCSDPLDWKDVLHLPEKREEPQTTDADNILAQIAEETETKKDDEKPLVPGIHRVPDTPKPDTAVKVPEPEMLVIQIPASMSRHQDRRDFINQVLGTVPQGYKDLKTIKITKERFEKIRSKVKNLQIVDSAPSIKDGAKPFNGETKVEEPVKTVDPSAPTKTEPSKEDPLDKIAAYKKKIADAKAAEEAAAKGKVKDEPAVPVLDKKEHDALADWWLKQPEVVKTLEGTGEAVSLDVIRDAEKAYPNFNDLVGEKNLNIMLRAKYDMFFSLAKDHPKQAAILLKDFRNLVQDLIDKVAELEQETEGKRRHSM